MNSNSFQISLTFNQILDLVKQLPAKEKTRLSEELVKEAIGKRLSRLLNSFQTEDLSEELINEEVEKVRAEIYARKGKN